MTWLEHLTDDIPDVSGVDAPHQGIRRRIEHEPIGVEMDGTVTHAAPPTEPRRRTRLRPLPCAEHVNQCTRERLKLSRLGVGITREGHAAA